MFSQELILTYKSLSRNLKTAIFEAYKERFGRGDRSCRDRLANRSACTPEEYKFLVKQVKFHANFQVVPKRSRINSDSFNRHNLRMEAVKEDRIKRKKALNDYLENRNK